MGVLLADRGCGQAAAHLADCARRRPIWNAASGAGEGRPHSNARWISGTVLSLVTTQRVGSVLFDGIWRRNEALTSGTPRFSA